MHIHLIHGSSGPLECAPQKTTFRLLQLFLAQPTPSSRAWTVQSYSPGGANMHYNRSVVLEILVVTQTWVVMGPIMGCKGTLSEQYFAAQIQAQLSLSMES